MLVSGVNVTEVDDNTLVIYLELPPSQVVLLQGVYELSEGIGILRTLDAERALVCIITTPDMIGECVSVLNAVRDKIAWREAEAPEGDFYLRKA